MIPLTHYYVEKEYASIDEGMEKGPEIGIREVADIIRQIGADPCIMATDFGRYALPTPVEGLREFITCMLDLGIPSKDIRKMVKTNPERLLGLEPLE
jgi:predicted TIM-barrel fold metal-dependent hydrolase